MEFRTPFDRYAVFSCQQLQTWNLQSKTSWFVCHLSNKYLFLTVLNAGFSESSFCKSSSLIFGWNLTFNSLAMSISPFVLPLCSPKKFIFIDCKRFAWGPIESNVNWCSGTSVEGEGDLRVRYRNKNMLWCCPEIKEAHLPTADTSWQPSGIHVERERRMVLIRVEQWSPRPYSTVLVPWSERKLRLRRTTVWPTPLHFWRSIHRGIR